MKHERWLYSMAIHARLLAASINSRSRLFGARGSMNSIDRFFRMEQKFRSFKFIVSRNKFVEQLHNERAKAMNRVVWCVGMQPGPTSTIVKKRRSGRARKTWRCVKRSTALRCLRKSSVHHKHWAKYSSRFPRWRGPIPQFLSWAKREPEKN